jgi:hypothetical protein
MPERAITLLIYVVIAIVVIVLLFALLERV